MLKITHQIKKNKITKELKEASFMLSNKKGGYLALGTNTSSQHFGFFINDNFVLYKTIENIIIDGKVKEILNKFSSVILKRDNKAKEEFTLPYNHNSFIYELNNYKGDLILDLDCRIHNDKDDWGRFYNVHLEKDRIIIDYEKQSDYNIYVVITGKKLKAEKIREWKKTNYPLDERRKDDSYQNIYSAIRLKINKDTKLIFSASTNRKDAISEGDYIYRNINKLKRKQKNALLFKSGIKNKEISMAYNATLNSLNSLLSNIKKQIGIVSGFPYNPFYKFRDEMIAIRSFGKKKEVFQILSRALKKIENDGLIQNTIPYKPQKSIDTTGWFYKKFKKKDKLDFVLNQLNKNYISNGLLTNDKYQTWMETIERKGQRIENQALLLNMYKNLKKKKEENKLKNQIIKIFWNKNHLKDGSKDTTIRPNCFLAYFIYPELLSKQKWKDCINHCLPKLWCNWGGITTVSKKSKLYKNKESHNGNSYFFLNNITASILEEISKKDYKININKIIESSTEDILWKGVLGHASEMSLSSKQNSLGNFCHATSASTYLELINKK